MAKFNNDYVSGAIWVAVGIPVASFNVWLLR
jgi:hypothetical protein